MATMIIKEIKAVLEVRNKLSRCLTLCALPVFLMIMLPLVAGAHDIEVPNADGITIYYNYINDGKELKVTYRGTSYSDYNYRYEGAVVIPEEVTYMNRTRMVTSIGEHAFDNCADLTFVTIPNSVTNIGEYAFYRCSGLTSVTIPNSVMSIGEYAFKYCKGLTSIIIPNSVTNIGNHTFFNCTNLTSITIPNSVTNIGDCAFIGCTGLTSITIPNSVTSIGERAFGGCTGLTSITIGNSVASISYGAFMNCTGLTSVTIPNSVTDIGSNVFEGVNISTVISKIEKPFKIEGINFGLRVFSINTFNNATLIVPKGTIEKYKATEGWKDFLFIEEMGGDGTTQKCEKPTICYSNGKLTFDSSTEGVTCYFSITDSDIKSGTGSEVQLGVTYDISVYATKSGYDNSDVATAILCWIDASPKTEGIVNGVAQIAARPVLVKTDNGFITVEGIDDSTNVSIYTTDGKQVGSAISQNNVATIATSVQPGSIAIVKVGEKAVKIVIK